MCGDSKIPDLTRQKLIFLCNAEIREKTEI